MSRKDRTFKVPYDGILNKELKEYAEMERLFDWMHFKGKVLRLIQVVDFHGNGVRRRTTTPFAMRELSELLDWAFQLCDHSSNEMKIKFCRDCIEITFLSRTILLDTKVRVVLHESETEERIEFG